MRNEKWQRPLSLIAPCVFSDLENKLRHDPYEEGLIPN